MPALKREVFGVQLLSGLPTKPSAFSPILTSIGDQCH